MRNPAMLAHGEGMFTFFGIMLVAGLCALGCLVGAALRIFSKDISERKRGCLFAAAGLLFLLVALYFLQVLFLG